MPRILCVALLTALLVAIGTAETAWIDLTEVMRERVQDGGSRPREDVVTISLDLEPRPDAQPEPSEYRVVFEGERFTVFSKIPR